MKFDDEDNFAYDQEYGEADREHWYAGRGDGFPESDEDGYEKRGEGWPDDGADGSENGYGTLPFYPGKFRGFGSPMEHPGRDDGKTIYWGGDKRPVTNLGAGWPFIFVNFHGIK